LADLVLLDLKSPNLAPAHSQIANVVYSAHAGNVTDVIVDGKLLVENRRLLSMDEEKIIEGAQKEAEKLAAG
jgi:5-methylthioadenosine/S-adenosylhomocysteine deaminase